MFFGLFRRKSKWDDAAAALYSEIVGQARRPAFYLEGGVADTVDGRFDLVALHAYLVMRRLKTEDDPRAADLSQALFDHMFRDMDNAIREIGVSDLSVGRKVKQMAKAFYGRVAAYDEGLEKGADVLAAALERNLFRKTDTDPATTARLAAYVRREAEALDAQPREDLLAGTVRFGAFPGDRHP